MVERKMQLLMDKTFIISKRYKIICLVLVALGVAAAITGFLSHPERMWANVLLNNYLFLQLAIGAAFFLALQYITQSGWSAMFKRIPESMSFYLPVAAVLFLLMIPGMHSLYHWTHAEEVAADPILAHKAPYLNIPFWIFRSVVSFALWILLIVILRRLSLREDAEGGLKYFERSEFYSKVLIFIIAITFSVVTIDWLMSVEPHWYSTLFSLQGFLTAFYHASATIALIAIILWRKGYFPAMNESHLLDFSRYIFMLSIVWGYFFFAQFMLIWYANIPEETEYYYHRWHNGFEWLFYFNIIVNWAIPFVLLLSKWTNKKWRVVAFVAVLLVIGHYTDLYEKIFPPIVHSPKFGFIEIGSFLGYAGIFAWVFGYMLSKAAVIPKNHPYIEESTEHHLH
jgi:hypothetical protein